MSNEQKQHLHEVLRQYERRLRVLERRAAMLGSDASPTILLEIEDLVSNISRLHQQIEQLSSAPQEHTSDAAGDSGCLVMQSLLDEREYTFLGVSVMRRVTKRNVRLLYRFQ